MVVKMALIYKVYSIFDGIVRRVHGFEAMHLSVTWPIINR